MRNIMEKEKFLWDVPLQSMSWLPDKDDLSVRKYCDRKIEMTYFESSFLCGLLKKTQPEKILEVGVAAGGTTALILKSLQMLNLDAQLYSADLCHKYYANQELNVGYMVHKAVPKLTRNWKLFTGSVISEYLDEIGPDIDFCIIDTMHTLPGELLDFLCILPYLKHNATVVLHDTALHSLAPEFAFCYATQTLLSTVIADKILPDDPKNIEEVANIGAFKVTQDTYKYVENIFSALKLPWNYIPDDISLVNFNKFFSRHYDESLCDIFRQATNINAKLKDNSFRFDRKNIKDDKKFKTSVIITNYNYEKYLKQSIKSCLSNNADEIIIVNDGSTDNSSEILKEFEIYSHIIVVNKKNEGQMAAFRSAFEYITGDIVLFLDADDYYFDFYLDKVKKIYLQYPTVDFTFTPLVVENGTTLFKWSEADLFIGKTHWLMSQMMFSNFWAGGGAPTSGLAIRRSALQTILKAIPPSEDALWKTGADNCIIIGSSFANQNKFFISGKYVYYRTHSEQASIADKGDYTKIYPRFKEILDKYFGYTEATPQNYVEEYLQNYLFDEQTQQKYVTAIKNCPYLKESVNSAIVKMFQNRLDVRKNKNNNIYLCFNCDTRYIQHFIIALTSILHNAHEDDYFIIYLLSNDLSPEDIAIILSLKNIRHFEIEFISIDAEKFNNFPVDCHVSIATYFRLLLPEVIPQHINKILYLDCDIIVENSLSELYNTDISHYYLGAVEDFCSYSSLHYNEYTYKIYRDKYFNAGILLLNLQKLRHIGLYDKACQFLREVGKPRWWDQDILNMLFESKDIFYLPPQFNMQYWYSNATLRADEALIGRHYAQLCTPVIIHFLTDIKPWYNFALTHASNIFVKKYYFYLRLSCYCGKVQSFPLGIPYNACVLLIGFDPDYTDICKKKILKIQSDAHIVTKNFEKYTHLEKQHIGYEKYDAIFIVHPNIIENIDFSYLKNESGCPIFVIDKYCENVTQLQNGEAHKLFGSWKQWPSAQNYYGQKPSKRQVLKEKINKYRQILELQMSGHFDKEFYLSTYPDVAQAKISPIVHYVFYGAYENRKPTPWFDTKFYLWANPDVQQTGMNPFFHYVKYGRKEQRTFNHHL